MAGFAVTQMARSLGPPKPGLSGKYIHAVSGTVFTIETPGSGMVQRIKRGAATGEYKIPYALGSGTHAFAYLMELNGHLFQSPLGTFAGRGWGMSPGFENDRAPDFYRPVTRDCLFCHSGRARPVEGTFNTYRDPPFEAEGITCERCHGPSDAHLQNPVPGSIINPASLAPRARASVCEQCHLAGEERIPNPGKQLSDFRPGMELEEVYTVYINKASRDANGPNPLRVVSQVEQLALSRCARESPAKLWCGTCHDPHAMPANPKTYFRERCLACHGLGLLAKHPKPNFDCIGCHMPRRPVSDGAHTVFTDHRIARRPPAASRPAGSVPPAKELVAWREPAGPDTIGAGALAERNRGLAEIKVGDRLESFPMVNEGFKLLMDCWDKFPDDPAVLTGIGKGFLVANDGAHAAQVFEAAIEKEPNVALHYLHSGLAWKEAREETKAIGFFEKAIALDPQMEQPYRELLEIYSDRHDTEKLRDTIARYHQAFPEKLDAQRLARGVSPSMGRSVP
ncbi:MAG: hypothetical protein DMG21_21710 [Acidobacteria bacterium]|nr:MAG: hypothetical protein DMG21_21710 [Acidobacteriota bacterium]